MSTIWLWFLLCSHAINTNFGTGIYGTAGPQYVDGNNALVYYDANTGKVTTISSPKDNDDTEPLQSTIDQINNIYFYLTDIHEGISWRSVLIPFNLTDPSHNMETIELPSCWTSAGFNDIGQQIISNRFTGDIYLLCHSKTNFKNESDLYKLIWNNKINTLNITLIKAYNVGDTATDNFLYPTILDSKRNTLWALESYYSHLLNGTYMNNFDVINGTIYKQISIEKWKLLNGVYSDKLDKIINLNATSIKTSSNEYYLDINVTFADSMTAEIVQNVGKVNISNYYCNMPAVYTMDIINNMWYQLMYRRTDSSMCSSNNPALYGDLLSIDIENAVLINTVTICKNDFTNYHVNCPISIEFWY